MNQKAINQISVNQEQFNELSEMFKQLLREIQHSAEPDDPFISTRIPITDLAVYPELNEALPSIEEDFYRTKLSEEEKKEAIHSCHRCSSMNYQPPPLNDSASAA
ncbi:hypothetical protein AYI69_g6555, partial [Smittium culicis]